MCAPTSGRDPVEKLAEEFADRLRRGERPSLSEYTDRYPELAADIRDVFAALVEMEQLASVDGQSTGPRFPTASGGGPAFEQLGEYRILREVGRGGMGVVYEAVQESLGRHVALKVLPYHGLLSPIQLERFRREARAAARLHHTNIVPVFGVGEEGGTHFYAMQFIQGQGLDAVLDEVRRLHGIPEGVTRDGFRPEPALSEQVALGLVSGRFERLRALAADIVGRNADAAHDPDGLPARPPEADRWPARPSNELSESSAQLAGLTETQYYRSVAQVAIQVAEALAYAHGQGVLHRDIKPSNLLLDTHGTAWVADFGLAKADDSDDLTNTGDLVGTLRFMAPERFEGRCDVRSEVYSLGLTLYEMLTLRAAFVERDRLALIDRVRHQEPPRPCQCDPKIPRDLETIVLKAIAKDPADRYPTPAALAEDLRRFLADRPIRARRTPWRERAWRWCRRNPAVASLTAVALLLLVTVAVVSTVAAVWLKGERDRAARARDNEAVARGAAEQAERERRLELVQALQDRARAGRMSRRPGQRYASLDALAQAAQLARELDLPPERFAQLRHEAIACLALPDVRLAKTWDIWPSGTRRVLVDNAYQRYARVDHQGWVSVRRVADDAELYRLPGYDTETWVGWSADSRFLSVHNSAGQVKIWNLADTKAVAALPPLSNIVRSTFSPDSRQLAVSGGDGQLILYDLDSGRRIKQIALSGVAGSVAFHPTKRWLAMAFRNRIQIFDLELDQKLGEDLVHPAGAYSLTWHPDGRSLAAACDDLKIYVWDLVTRRPTAVLEGCRNGGIEFAFNRTGDLLASWDWTGILRFWHPRTGKQVFSTQGNMLAHSFSPDDRQIAARITGPSGQLEPGLWDVVAFREYRTLVHDPVPPGSDRVPSYYSGSLHPSGRWLALAMEDGARIWDLPSGRQLAWLPLGRTGGVWFEPSGALLTNGDSGWWRWPMHADGAAGSRLHIGPPDRLPVPGSFMVISGSHDGRVSAVPFLDGGVVLHADRPYQPVRLTPHNDVRAVSVSPDGRWAVTASHGDTGIKVWEAATGKLVKELLAEFTQCGSAFSPDGRWLVTGHEGRDLRLWAMDSWEPGVQIPNGEGVAFTVDGRVMATSISPGVLALIDPATGREYARLEDPNQDYSAWFAFTPDGTKLVTSSRLGLAIHVWDLRLIRQQLAALGLDWDGPPCWSIPRIPAMPRLPGAPAKAEIRGLDLVTQPGKWQHYQHARTLLTLALNPFAAEAHFLLGRELLGKRQVEAAYAQFTFALTFRPGFGAAYVQRAQAAFRLKRWADAVADASAALRDQPYDADTLSIRGQAYQQLGRHAEAVADFTAALDRYPRSSRLYELRAVSYAGLGKDAEAQADHRRALKMPPRRAMSLNNQAWQLVSGAADQRNPARALELSTEAVRLEPNNPVYLNTLGVVQYRLGRYAEAAATLEKSLAAGRGTHDAFDLFFLAMCYQHLGDATRARACYDRAVQWWRAQKDLRSEWDAELQAFQAEAAALLKPTP